MARRFIAMLLGAAFLMAAVAPASARAAGGVTASLATPLVFYQAGTVGQTVKVTAGQAGSPVTLGSGGSQVSGSVGAVPRPSQQYLRVRSGPGALLGAGFASSDGSFSSVPLSAAVQSGSTFTVQLLPLGARVVSGYGHSLMLGSDHTLWAWGWNGYGQLGTGSTTDGLTPAHLTGLGDIAAVSGGTSHTLALKADGTVWSWGDNSFGQLGTGDTTQRLAPVQVPGLTDVVAVAAGTNLSAAVRNDGTLWTWGRNNAGQLGLGTSTQQYLSPQQVSGVSGVTAVAGGATYTLILKSDGTVWAAGYNNSGQLGNGTTTTSTAFVQVVGPGGTGYLTGVTAIAAANYGSTSFALKSDGTLWGWGSNGYGQLGLGRVDSSGYTTPVQILSGVRAVTAGNVHTLAMKADGTFWAWGTNSQGQLGTGDTTNHYSPVQVPGLTGVVTIGAGSQYSCAVGQDGSVGLWGENRFGQIGNGTTTNALSPVKVTTVP